MREILLSSTLCLLSLPPAALPESDSHRAPYAADGGTDRSEADNRLDPDLSHQSATDLWCAVDGDDRLAALSTSLCKQVGGDRSLVGQQLSTVLSLPGGDLSGHLDAVRQQLDEPGVSTVRSTNCWLRPPAGDTPTGRPSGGQTPNGHASNGQTPPTQATRTVEWTRYSDQQPESESRPGRTEWLFASVRPAAVEIAEPQPAAGTSRFSALFDQLPDPVAEVRFVDGEPSVTSVNPAFEETFGYDEHELVGEPLNEYIVPESDDTDAAELDREAANGEWTAAEVIREAADGPRLFLFRGIPFMYDGQQHGFGVYTDVTDRESQQRYHEVLNRLLRHNLRNELNVILGLADQLANGEPTAGTKTEIGQKLKQRALELVETSRRARELESVIDRSATETVPVAVDELVAEACRLLEDENHTADLSYTVEQPTVGAAGDALQEALLELGENAIEHTKPGPTVEFRIDTSTDGKWVVITVADDGPGIPPNERAVVEGTRSISPLDHASGLGLWLAKWIVEAYGGELVFAGPDNELGGAAIELRIRRASEPLDE